MSAFEQLQQKLTIKINSSNNGIKKNGYNLRSVSTGNTPTSVPKFGTKTSSNSILLKPSSKDPARRLSAYLLNLTDPKHKAGRIKRMLRWNNMTEQDIARSLPSKYQDLYQLVRGKNGKNKNGFQGDINIVKNRENERFIMKSMKYKTVFELKKFMERYLIVFNNKFMDYKDVFIDIDNKKMHIIQPLFKQTIKEKLCSLKTRKFGKRQFNKIILQLIRRIDAIHSKGYVHHDLKPSNIMFDDDGNLHIIDFDLMEKHQTLITTKGTIGFIAPELFLPILDKSGQTKIESSLSMDIWSIGSIICYMAFKGRIPFHNLKENGQRINNLQEYMTKHSFLNEDNYRENKWSFIIDVQMDYGDDYQNELFRLISDLLNYKGNNRPNTKQLLTSQQYSWFNGMK